MNDYFEDTEFLFYLCKLIGDTNVEIFGSQAFRSWFI